MEILDRPNVNTPQVYPIPNRVIVWAIRDMTPINKSGYRGDLEAIIIKKRPEYETP